jgi:Putative auto-transporter adhesin, head GIN domain
MKKSNILIAAVLLTAIFNHSFGRGNSDSLIQGGPFYITTLVINAGVTVILVNNDEATLEATGDKSFKKFVRLEKTGDTLVISAKRNMDFYEGTIYVPASQLRKVHINSKAHVQSLFALQIPKLDVIVNGPCDFVVSNIGEVNITGTDNYSFEQSTVVRPLPASFHRKKE